MTSIRVSIIVPLFNVEEYVKSCIKSVQKQTLQEIEIICINDGSTDRTKDIVLELQKDDTRIVVLEQAHKGAGAARNLGMRHANGNYISFLDADDYFYDKNALKRMYEACETNKANICGSLRCREINGNVEEVPLFEGVCIPADIGRYVLYNEFQEVFYYQSFIFKRLFLQEKKIEFPDYLRYQDPPFFLDAMVHAKKFWVVPVYLYCYRYGHQNEALYGKRINYTLMGVRDNLTVALKYNYKQLFALLINRLNSTYYRSILDNLSEETLELLLEIQKLNRKQGEENRFYLLEDIYRFSMDYHILDKSYKMISRLFCLNQNSNLLQEYCKKQGWQRIAVYGLGHFGKIFVDELLKIDGISVIGIDKLMNDYRDLKIFMPEDELPYLDVIIVSPVRSDEILQILKQKKRDAVLLLDVLKDIF